MSTRAAIVAPLRTPVGRFGGALRPVPAEDLAAAIVRAVVERSGIDPARIEDVALARSLFTGTRAGDFIPRTSYAAVAAIIAALLQRGALRA